MIKIVPVEIFPGMVTNCYIVGDKESGKGIVIDPGAEGDKIIKAVEEIPLSIEYIVNTHGHYDHIGANGVLKDKFDAEIFIHNADAEMLTDPNLNLSFKEDRDETEDPPADKLLEEGDEIAAGSIKLHIIHTPGHTPGCICLQGEDDIFTGDTLFAGSAGRTDLPGGSSKELGKSFSSKLANLPDNLNVYPGHGPSSTIKKEKAQNPFMK